MKSKNNKIKITKRLVEYVDTREEPRKESIQKWEKKAGDNHLGRRPNFKSYFSSVLFSKSGLITGLISYSFFQTNEYINRPSGYCDCNTSKFQKAFGKIDDNYILDKKLTCGIDGLITT